MSIQDPNGIPPSPKWESTTKLVVSLTLAALLTVLLIYFRGIIGPIILAFILAHLVKLPLHWIGLFRTIYFLPVVIGLGASSLIWVWLLNDRVGIFNKILIDLGLIDKAVLWLGDKNLALAVIIISVVWKTVGFTMILLLAGLQSIPDEFYELNLERLLSSFGQDTRRFKQGIFTPFDTMVEVR